MQIGGTSIEGVLILHPRVHRDARGYFMESYKLSSFQRLGLPCPFFVQENESLSEYGVIRGLHYQLPPHAQAKLVRVVEGEVLDVALDIRRDSPTFGQHVAVRLSADNHAMLYIPRGLAHGFSVLSPRAKLLYRCDAEWCQDAERSIRYDDPALAIDWQIPAERRILSEKDAESPLFSDAEF